MFWTEAARLKAWQESERQEQAARARAIQRGKSDVWVVGTDVRKSGKKKATKRKAAKPRVARARKPSKSLLAQIFGFGSG